MRVCYRTHMLFMTMEDETKLTIKTLARMANVSIGTVDRVIHNRGRVSEENVIKIKALMKEYHYKPNPIARSLAVKKSCRLVAVIPSYAPGEYWEDIAKGIMRAEEELSNYRVKVEVMPFDQYDSDSFEQIIARFGSDAVEADGVIIGTLFAEAVKRLSGVLDAKHIPYIYVDADIAGLNRMAYYGTDSYQGGRLGARLLLARLPEQSDLLVAKIRHRGSVASTQGANRRRGFVSYLQEHGFGGRMHEVELHLSDAEHNRKVLDSLMADCPDIRGAVTFNSSCHILGEYFRQSGNEAMRVVGYDLTERNVKLLNEGYVQCLIAQHPELQGYCGVKALSRHLLLDEKVPSVNLFPIDVLFKENISYYHNLSNLISI